MFYYHVGRMFLTVKVKSEDAEMDKQEGLKGNMFEGKQHRLKLVREKKIVEDVECVEVITGMIVMGNRKPQQPKTNEKTK